MNIGIVDLRRTQVARFRLALLGGGNRVGGWGEMVPRTKGQFLPLSGGG